LAKGIPDFANFDDERAKCLAGAVFPTQQACQLERARSSHGQPVAAIQDTVYGKAEALEPQNVRVAAV
jgi:hypothetical protein